MCTTLAAGINNQLSILMTGMSGFFNWCKDIIQIDNNIPYINNDSITVEPSLFKHLSTRYILKNVWISEFVKISEGYSRSFDQML